MSDDTDHRDQDRRQFERVESHKTVHVDVPEQNKDYETMLLDISLKGMLLDKPDGWDVGESNAIKATIPLSEDEQIKLTGHVAHEEAGELGIEWDEIEGESMAHLRRMLELNLGDAAEIQREITELSR